MHTDTPTQPQPPIAADQPQPVATKKRIGKLDTVMIYMVGGAAIALAAYTAINDGDIGKGWAAMKNDMTQKAMPLVTNGVQGVVQIVSGDRDLPPGIPTNAQPLQPAIATAAATPNPTAAATYDPVADPASNPPPSDTTIAMLTLNAPDGAIAAATPECEERSQEITPFTVAQYIDLLIKIDGGSNPDLQSVIDSLGRPYCPFPAMGSGGDRLTRLAWIGDHDGIPHVAIAAFRDGGIARSEDGAPFISLKRIERIEPQWQEASKP